MNPKRCGDEISMDQQRIVEFEAKCTQEHPPACVTACPVHVDVKSFMAAMRVGNPDQALQIFRKNVRFPGIIGRACDHPCQDVCKRRNAGDAISIAALERVCVETSVAPPVRMIIPVKKEQRVAVAGGGLSGLGAAADLAAKGYGVVIFEATDRLGGRLWEIPADQLPPRVIREDTAILDSLGVEKRFNATVGQTVSLADLQREFDAVYLGLGKTAGAIDGLMFDQPGRVSVDPVIRATGLDGVFAGGGMLGDEGYSPVGSLSGGRRAAISIDRYLQGVSLTAGRENEGPYRTRLFTSTEGIEPASAVAPADPGRGYTMEEAAAEAERCLMCQCLECVKACVYLDHFKAYPKRYVRQINHNLKMIMGLREANTLINSCSLCGQCGEICPEGFNMADLCREARNEMFKKGKMPPSAHDFPIRDMHFSNSGMFALTRHQPGYDSSNHVFFPGCQLSASNPDLTARAYTYLTERVSGGVGLMLRCCGAPAEWSGRAELFQAGMREIKDQWLEMGRPKVISACSTCYQMFKQYLPGAEIVSLWEVYDRMGLPEGAAPRNPALVAVQDSCSTRHEKQIHQSVRNILQKLGIKTEELPAGREITECCGYGGLMSFANRELARKVIRRRIDQSPADYVAYCAMCRDNYAAGGKKTYHLLELIYGVADADLPAARGPGYSQRRENRARLKSKMLKEVWGDKPTVEEKPHEAIKLVLSGQVSEIMEERLILKEDVQKVIEYAERTGSKMLNRGNSHILACHAPVSVTYWVEYTPGEGGFVIHNVYSHRMKVEGNN